MFNVVSCTVPSHQFILCTYRHIPSSLPRNRSSRKHFESKTTRNRKMKYFHASPAAPLSSKDTPYSIRASPERKNVEFLDCGRKSDPFFHSCLSPFHELDSNSTRCTPRHSLETLSTSSLSSVSPFRRSRFSTLIRRFG